MVKSIEDGYGDDLGGASDLNWRIMRFGRVATESLVRSFGVVIAIYEFTQESFEVALVKDDDVVEQFSP
jgi:hypothetical protein